ncbi:hypothetical protein DXG01_014145, partial [Tephrocybe rancida]
AAFLTCEPTAVSSNFDLGTAIAIADTAADAMFSWSPMSSAPPSRASSPAPFSRPEAAVSGVMFSCSPMSSPPPSRASSSVPSSRQETADAMFSCSPTPSAPPP